MEALQRNLFRTLDEGWAAFGLRPLEVWREESLREYCEKELPTENDEKAYRLYLRRTVKQSPSSAAGVELFLKSNCNRFDPYLRDFRGDWKETEEEAESEDNFCANMYQMAVSSTRFQLAMLDVWRKWCEREEKPETRQSFVEFASTLPPDLPLGPQLMERLHFFSRSFPSWYQPPLFSALPSPSVSLSGLSFLDGIEEPPPRKRSYSEVVDLETSFSSVGIHNL